MRYKESDRIEAMENELKKLGVQILQMKVISILKEILNILVVMKYLDTKTIE